MALTTSNGTECILAAASNPNAVTLIGALLNATAVARTALNIAKKMKKDISIVVAGRNNQPAPEDVIVASEIIFSMRGLPVRGTITPINSKDFVMDFLNCDSGRNLAELGKRDDVIFCAQKDRYETIPVVRDMLIVPCENVF